MLGTFGKRLLRGAREERGQYLVLFVVLFSLILGLAAFTIDQGIWLNERRISQKDADAAALGGAQAYQADLSDLIGAEAQARLVAERNLADIEADLTAFSASVNCDPYDGDGDGAPDDIVWDDVPSIRAEINAPTGGFFSRLFGIGDIDTLGADAVACVGSPAELQGIDPFYVAPNSDRPEPECFDANDLPALGSICAIMGPSHFHDVGQRGTITLQYDPNDPGNNQTECTQPSGNDLAGHVVTGADAWCGTGDEVHADGGTFQNVDAQLRCRILGYDDVGNSCPNGFRSTEAAPGEGFCDSEFGQSGQTVPPFNGSGLDPAFDPDDVISSPSGMDDFTEAFTNPATGGPPTSYDSPQFLVPNLCDGRMSPRIVTIVLAEGPVDQNGDCVDINANGCVVIDQFAMFFILGCRDVDGPNSFTFVGEIDPFCNNINAARTALVGVFVKAFIPGGGGPLTSCDEAGVLGCSIVLVE